MFPCMYVYEGVGKLRLTEGIPYSNHFTAAQTWIPILRKLPNKLWSLFPSIWNTSVLWFQFSLQPPKYTPSQTHPQNYFFLFINTFHLLTSMHLLTPTPLLRCPFHLSKYGHPYMVNPRAGNNSSSAEPSQI